MIDLVARLELDHARFHRYMTGFLSATERPHEAEPRRLMLFHELAQYFATYPDELHHREEDIVYERLMACGRTDHAATRGLWNEHEILSVKAKDFANTVAAMLSGGAIVASALAEAGRIYFGALARHMTMEDEILLGPARTRLRAKDFEAIEEGLAVLYAERINFDKARAIKALERSLDDKLGAL